MIPNDDFTEKKDGKDTKIDEKVRTEFLKKGGNGSRFCEVSNWYLGY